MFFIVLQPENFKPESTSIWSFPNRGSWATHSGKYRGNWSPYVPRNIILRYSAENDWILDQFVGGGTTLVEAKLLGRNAIGVDINENAIRLSEQNINMGVKSNNHIICRLGDATNLSFLKDNSIDLICTHPPYADIIKYSNRLEGDISLLSVDDFVGKMIEVAKESYRVLKNGKICAFMIGDIRKNKNVIPLGFQVMQEFINEGFKNKEIIIKEQHNCRSTDFWIDRNRDFLLLAHEYIFVLQK